MNYLIIGNSAAAIGCVEGIRQIDKTGPITIVSSETQHTYSRPLISYLLYGKTDENKMKYRPDSFYNDMGCRFIPGKTVVSIDKDKKTVLLDDGNSLDYDKLLIATGSRPFVPPIEGLEKVGRKFTFMSLDDALALDKVLSKDTEVLIMGAGLIGLKCAEGICHKVKKITVVDLADRILPSVLDEDAASIVQKHIEKQGIEFILSDSVKSMFWSCAVLSSGKKIDFDILVIAVGVRPNTQLAKEAGAQVGRGIVIDECSVTTLPDIYAAGDCTETIDVCTGESKILAILPNAYMQGECAGINMAGGAKNFNKAIAMNAVGFFGLHIITAGSYEGEAYVNREEGNYKKLVTENGRLKGYILVGDVARAGIYTSLIKNQTDLDTLDFELIKDKPQLIAFSKIERERMLGGRK